MKLTKAQRDIARAKKSDKTFLRGIAGGGKTTVGAERLKHWLTTGKISAAQVLVWLPQKTLAPPYMEAQADAAKGQANVLTLGSLSRKVVDLFWPLVAEEHGFQAPELRPTFLSLETAQYFMARVVGPEIDRNGYFDTVTIDRNRLYSQIIDNLNKAAVIDGIESTEISERLKSAFPDQRDQNRMYDDVQTCANLFRAYCMAHNLLDFSLQVDVFNKRLLPLPEVQRYLQGMARFIIADNIEEDTPVSHKLLRGLLDAADGALMIYDEDAGYRQFLGADEMNALRLLSPACEREVRFEESFVMSADVQALGAELLISLNRPVDPPQGDFARAMVLPKELRYYPQMIDDAVMEVAALVEGQGVEPKNIVLIAPYMSDALRFSLMNRLQERGIAARSHRPSRSLRQEPAAQAMLTLAQIAHPAWGIAPTKFDVAYMLMQSIGKIDLVRAQLLASYAYTVTQNRPAFVPFEKLKPDTQERVTFLFGERFDRLQAWINAYTLDAPLDLDHFFSRLFGELLSQPGFGFHADEQTIKDAATVAANLIYSAQKFRRIIEDSGAELAEKSAAQEYIERVMQGIIADQYLASWETDAGDAVLVAPAFTYLLSNRPVDYQFWLNVGSTGWSERLYQPLTNPFVLALDWIDGRIWTEQDEFGASQDQLYRLITGLTRRARKGIYLGHSDLSEQGYEQRGELLGVVQRTLKRNTP